MRMGFVLGDVAGSPRIRDGYRNMSRSEGRYLGREREGAAGWYPFKSIYISVVADGYLRPPNASFLFRFWLRFVGMIAPNLIKLEWLKAQTERSPSRRRRQMTQSREISAGATIAPLPKRHTERPFTHNENPTQTKYQDSISQQLKIDKP